MESRLIKPQIKNENYIAFTRNKWGYSFHNFSILDFQMFQIMKCQEWFLVMFVAYENGQFIPECTKYLT